MVGVERLFLSEVGRVLGGLQRSRNGVVEAAEKLDAEEVVALRVLVEHFAEVALIGHCLGNTRYLDSVLVFKQSKVEVDFAVLE